MQFGIIATKSLKKIDRETQLYFSYGSEYTCPEVKSNTESQEVLFKSNSTTSLLKY